jgi:hypothetical protein
MASDFSSKYGRTPRSTGKPDCFGDPEYHDPKDPYCRDCPSEAACNLIIRRKHSNRTRARVARRGDVSRPTARQDIDKHVEEPAEEGDTFSTTLIHNASLNAIQGALDTASHAWTQIPRKGYRNIFHSARNRKKKKE